MAKYDLALSTAFMNASGSLGFLPQNDLPGLARLGAFITNPLSLQARSPARNPCVLPFPGGFLMHTGFPNPGLDSALKRYASPWSRLEIPVIVHLLISQLTELKIMLARLEGSDAAMAVELDLPPKFDSDVLLAIAQAALGELPVILRVPLDRVMGLVGPLSQLTEEGIAAISLGPPRGALPSGSARPVHGRLYGPAIFPQALAAVELLARSGVPVIGAGGIYTLEQAETMLMAGAIAIQLDMVFWRGEIPER